MSLSCWCLSFVLPLVTYSVLFVGGEIRSKTTGLSRQKYTLRKLEAKQNIRMVWCQNAVYFIILSKFFYSQHLFIFSKF